MLKSHLSDISKLLIKYGFGPEKIERITSEYGAIYKLKNEPRMNFVILEDEFDYKKLKYTASKFDKKFTQSDQSGYFDIYQIKTFMEKWILDAMDCEAEIVAIDPWDEFNFSPPNELTSGIESIDFDSQELFSEEEQRLIEADLNKTEEFIRNEVGLDGDRLAVIEKDIAEIKQELSKRSKFSWKEFAREKLIDELINAAKDRFSLVQLYKLFEFLGPFDLPQLGN